MVSVPHRPDNATYQDSYTTFAIYADQAMGLGWSLKYGSQPISRNAVLRSLDTPLNLRAVEQDCKEPNSLSAPIRSCFDAMVVD